MQQLIGSIGLWVMLLGIVSCSDSSGSNDEPLPDTIARKQAPIAVDTDTNTDTDINADTDTSEDADTDTDTGADTDTNADTETDPSEDTDTDTDTDTDAVDSDTIPIEICDNGIDDDSDGAIDCADTDCVQMSCVPSPPDGWEGPVLLFEGEPDAVPTCDGEMSQLLLDAGLAPEQTSLTCSPCSCHGPGERGAEAPTCVLDFEARNKGVAACAGGLVATLEMDATTCVEVPSTNYVFGSFVADGGTCEPDGGVVTERPTPRWTRHVRGCGFDHSVGVGCAQAERCISTPNDTFTDVCVFRSGTMDCPTHYPHRNMYYNDMNDSRSCSACECGAIQNGSCTADVIAWENENCTGSSTTDFNGTWGACQYTPSGTDETALSIGNLTFSGECNPEGQSYSSGNVTPIEPVTVCCQ